MRDTIFIMSKKKPESNKKQIEELKAKETKLKAIAFDLDQEIRRQTEELQKVYGMIRSTIKGRMTLEEKNKKEATK